MQQLLPGTSYQSLRQLACPRQQVKPYIYATQKCRSNKLYHSCMHRACVVTTASLFGDFRNTKNHAVVPDHLLKCGTFTKQDCQNTPTTVYTVRLSTGYKRGSALNEPMAGVMLCLVGKDGNAVLQTIPPVADVADAAQQLQYICSVVDQSAGANCDLATSPDAPWANTPTPTTSFRRFQEGHVDEVVFLGPELGPLAACYIAPEGGSWMLDEINVSSSRTGHLDRFVCRKKLGYGTDDSAVCLTPVPTGAVVYGSGESAVILTKEQAAVVRAVGTAEYASLKDRLLLSTAALAGGGSCLAAALAGPDYALPFAVGGAGAVLYQWLLQQGADNLAVEVQEQQEKHTMARSIQVQEQQRRPAAMVASSTTRLLVLASLALCAICAVQDPSAEGESAAAIVSSVGQGAALQQLVCGVAGFMTYKLALLGVYLAPQPVVPAQTAQPLNRNS